MVHINQIFADRLFHKTAMRKTIGSCIPSVLMRIELNKREGAVFFDMRAQQGKRDLRRDVGSEPWRSGPRLAKRRIGTT